MKTADIKINFDKTNGNYEIFYKGFSWVSDGRKPNITIRKKNKKGKYVSVVRSFQSAKNKQTVFTDNKITTTYSDFSAFGKKLPFSLICTAEITSENTVVFSLKAENEADYDIQAVYFPAPFNSKKKGKLSYHVDSMRQGFILPDGNLRHLIPAIGYTKVKRPINSGDVYMPVWGRVCDLHSFTAIVETPYDASMFSSLGKHGAFINSVYWLSSLGKLSYERKICFVFHEIRFPQKSMKNRSFMIKTAQTKYFVLHLHRELSR